MKEKKRQKVWVFQAPCPLAQPVFTGKNPELGAAANVKSTDAVGVMTAAVVSGRGNLTVVADSVSIDIL